MSDYSGPRHHESQHAIPTHGFLAALLVLRPFAAFRRCGRPDLADERASPDCIRLDAPLRARPGPVPRQYQVPHPARPALNVGSIVVSASRKWR